MEELSAIGSRICYKEWIRFVGKQVLFTLWLIPIWVDIADGDLAKLLRRIPFLPHPSSLALNIAAQWRGLYFTYDFTFNPVPSRWMHWIQHYNHRAMEHKIAWSIANIGRHCLEKEKTLCHHIWMTNLDLHTRRSVFLVAISLCMWFWGLSSRCCRSCQMTLQSRLNVALE